MRWFWGNKPVESPWHYSVRQMPSHCGMTNACQSMHDTWAHHTNKRGVSLTLFMPHCHPPPPQSKAEGSVFLSTAFVTPWISGLYTVSWESQTRTVRDPLRCASEYTAGNCSWEEKKQTGVNQIHNWKGLSLPQIRSTLDQIYMKEQENVFEHCKNKPSFYWSAQNQPVTPTRYIS